MKRLITICLFLTLLGVSSCSEDELKLLTPNLILDLNAYDLDNNSNASDIRIDFSVSNNQEVVEYRIMILQSSLRPQFNLEDALALSPTNFERVEPKTSGLEYSVSRLRSSLLDVNNNPVEKGIEYVVVVLIVGTDDQQLSEFSSTFLLRDQGRYSGEYTVDMGSDWNVNNGTVTHAVVSDSLGVYYGEFFGQRSSSTCSEADDDDYWGYFSFVVSSNTITDFDWEIKTWCVLPECTNISLLCGECSLNWVGTGVLEDEIVINMNNISDIEPPGAAEPCYHGWAEGVVLNRR